MRTKQTLLIATLTALIGGVATANTDVHFSFDSAALPATADGSLESMARAAQAHPNQRVVLDGHADPVGAASYNVALSLRRAEAVRDKLIGLGVDSERIVLSSYGEDAPVGTNHAAERRVSMWLTTNAVSEVIDRAFVRHGTSVSWEKPMTTAQIGSPSTQPIAAR
jgi:outer membrane protein OmpA-like peptidoglycan-associated protein